MPKDACPACLGSVPGSEKPAFACAQKQAFSLYVSAEYDGRDVPKMGIVEGLMMRLEGLGVAAHHGDLRERDPGGGIRRANEVGELDPGDAVALKGESLRVARLCNGKIRN